MDANKTTNIEEVTVVEPPVDTDTVNYKQGYDLMPLFITGLTTMLLTLSMAMLGFKYWQDNHQLRIVTVKMSDVLSDHILEIGSSRLSEQQKEQYALRWSVALDDTIKELTEDNRTIVLTQNTSIAGVEDFTELVEISAKNKVGGINEFGNKAQTQ